MPPAPFRPPRPLPRVPPPPARATPRPPPLPRGYDEPEVTVDFPLSEQPTGETAGGRAQHAGVILATFDALSAAHDQADLAELVSLYGANPARRRLMLALVRDAALY